MRELRRRDYLVEVRVVPVARERTMTVRVANCADPADAEREARMAAGETWGYDSKIVAARAHPR